MVDKSQDWLFEIRHDGFRALVHIELVSRNRNEFKSFRTSCESLGTEVKQSGVLDGEIVCLGGKGRSLFYELLFGRGEPGFIGDHVQVRGGKYQDCLGEVVGMSLTASAPTFTIEFEDGSGAEIAEGLPSKGA